MSSRELCEAAVEIRKQLVLETGSWGSYKESLLFFIFLCIFFFIIRPKKKGRLFSRKSPINDTQQERLTMRRGRIWKTSAHWPGLPSAVPAKVVEILPDNIYRWWISPLPHDVIGSKVTGKIRGSTTCVIMKDDLESRMPAASFLSPSSVSSRGHTGYWSLSVDHLPYRLQGVRQQEWGGMKKTNVTVMN